jgi:hypothetical protein
MFRGIEIDQGEGWEDEQDRYSKDEAEELAGAQRGVWFDFVTCQQLLDSGGFLLNDDFRI